MERDWLELAQKMTVRHAFRRLSPREREVVEAIIGGLTNKEIALDLGISAYTVDEYIRRLFIKHDVNTRSQLVAVILCQRWLRSTLNGI